MKAGAIAAIVAAALAFPASADIYMAGDAAVCDYPAALYPQQGWGQALAEFMIDPARLHNLALDGCSAKRYKEGGHWRKLADAVGEGDFVIVSFGPGGIREVHGGREAALREYESLLAGFVADVRAKGAAPILATPVPHSGGFSVEDGRIKVDGGAAGVGECAAATVRVGRELGVPVLDINGYAERNLPELGIDAALRLYMRIVPGEYANCPQGKTDGYHTRDTGAFWFAKAAVILAERQKLPVCGLWKDSSAVSHAPIPWGGPGGGDRPDAAAPAPKKAVAGNWRQEVRALRLEAEAKGMGRDAANRWAVREYRRRRGR